MTARSLVADLVVDVLDDHCRLEDVVAVEQGGHSAELWARFEELGLTLATVPEASGGAGADPEEDFAILRLAGRYAAPLPLVESGFLAGRLLAEAGLTAEPGVMTVAPVRRGERIALRRRRAPLAVADGAASRGTAAAGSAWVLAGRAHAVPFASAADRLVVLAHREDGAAFVAVVPREACAITPRRNVAGEWRDDVELDEVVVEDGAVAHAATDHEQLLRRGALGRATMMLGALEAVRDLSLRHAREREQFGRPLARFQAVQGLVALIARETALARAIVEHATQAALAHDSLGLRDVAAAKVVCGRAATAVAGYAHQVHGAIGITKEHALHLLTRRLWAWREDYGSEQTWSRELGAWLQAQPGGLWHAITEEAACPA